MDRTINMRNPCFKRKHDRDSKGKLVIVIFVRWYKYLTNGTYTYFKTCEMCVIK